MPPRPFVPGWAPSYISDTAFERLAQIRRERYLGPRRSISSAIGRPAYIASFLTNSAEQKWAFADFVGMHHAFLAIAAGFLILITTLSIALGQFLG